MRHDSPSSKTIQPDFTVRNRFVLGWAAILMVVGSYGFYLFHLRAPDQKKRLTTLEQTWQKKISLSSLVHHDNLKKQENYYLLKQGGRVQETRTASLQARKSDTLKSEVFLTTTEKAPSEKEIQKETAEIFSHQEAVISEDRPAAKIAVAFRPVNTLKDIESNFEDGDDFIEGQTVEETDSPKQNKAPQFALQLMSSRSLYVIEEKWYEMKEADTDNLLDELQPKFIVSHISENKKNYTLLAGSFKTASQAVMLCKKIKSLSETCSETIYRGETLFQSEPSDDFPVGSIASDGAPKIR